MTHLIVILGAGTGGTLTANRLRRKYGAEAASIAVVDLDDTHIYQPGLLFVPFGLARAEDIVRPRARQLHRGIDVHTGAIDRVDLDGNRVLLQDGTELGYDVLVVATGARLQPEDTEGLLGPAWNQSLFTFYDLAGATALHDAIAGFTGGDLVVAVMDMPIKCPVAPLEFCFLADWFFTEHGLRDKVRIHYVTPLDAVFTRPIAAARLAEMLAAKHIEVTTEFNTGSIDAEGKKLVGYDGREVGYDLGVIVPLHGGAEYVGRSGDLGDELGWVAVDHHTLQAKCRPNVFALGDAAGVPTSKAGSVTHFEGEILTDNIVRFLAGEPLEAKFDGHSNCFIETGFGKAVLIDFNYETEPLPGHFPGPIGLPLLQESRMAHLGKLMFQWLYWHVLLPGHKFPGIGADMPQSGKHHPTT